jgi:hypothetical protein
MPDLKKRAAKRRERTVSTGSNDVDEIYHRMAVIRREPHTHVREAVAGAEAIVDWGRYTWTYPWIALGAAAAAGYVIYAGAHQKAAAGTASPIDGATAGEPVAATRTKGQERFRIGQNLLLAAWNIVFPVAVRAGQNYMLNWLEQQYATRTTDRALVVGRGAQRLDGAGLSGTTLNRKNG